MNQGNWGPRNGCKSWNARNLELRRLLGLEPPGTEEALPRDGAAIQALPLDLRQRLLPNQPSDPEEKTLRAYWNNGFEAANADRSFLFRLGGTIDFDNSWYALSSAMQPTLTNPLLDGSELRRARVRAGGTAFTQFDFLFEADFSSGSDFRTLAPDPQTPLYLTHAWVAMNEIPWIGTIRVGHQRELLTFSNSTDGRFLPFMERPYLYDAFNDFFQYSTGIAATRDYFDQRLQSWVGLFRTGTRTGAFGVGDGDGAFSARLNWQPLLNPERERWMTMGAAGSVRTIPKDPGYMFYSARPLTRAGSAYQVPFLVVTPELYSPDLVNYLNFNLHTAWGPFSLGGEFLSSWMTNTLAGGFPVPGAPVPSELTPAGNLAFNAFYIELLCFLTPGDHRPLDLGMMGYDRVLPRRNFFWKKRIDPEEETGWGAWEAGLRLDQLNLNSGLIQAGNLQSLSLGINWYWNPNMKLVGNYIYTFREVEAPQGTGNIQAFGLRAHVDF